LTTRVTLCETFADMAEILHLIAANHRRGAETLAVELADHLRDCGHGVRILAVTDVHPEEPLQVETAGSSRVSPSGIAKVVAATNRADVVVAFGSSALLVGAAACR